MRHRAGKWYLKNISIKRKNRVLEYRFFLYFTYYNTYSKMKKIKFKLPVVYYKHTYIPEI